MNSPLLRVLVFSSIAARFAAANEPLPGTKPLTMEGDLSEQMIAVLCVVCGGVACDMRWRP